MSTPSTFTPSCDMSQTAIGWSEFSHDVIDSKRWAASRVSVRANGAAIAGFCSAHRHCNAKRSSERASHRPPEALPHLGLQSSWRRTAGPVMPRCSCRRVRCRRRRPAAASHAVVSHSQILNMMCDCRPSHYQLLVVLGRLVLVAGRNRACREILEGRSTSFNATQKYQLYMFAGNCELVVTSVSRMLSPWRSRSACGRRSAGYNATTR